MVANGSTEPYQLIFGREGCAGSYTVDMTRISMLMVRNISMKSSLSRTSTASGKLRGGSIGSPSCSYLVVRMGILACEDGDVR